MKDCDLCAVSRRADLRCWRASVSYAAISCRLVVSNDVPSVDRSSKGSIASEPVLRDKPHPVSTPDNTRLH